MCSSSGGDPNSAAQILDGFARFTLETGKLSHFNEFRYIRNRIATRSAPAYRKSPPPFRGATAANKVHRCRRISPGAVFADSPCLPKRRCTHSTPPRAFWGLYEVIINSSCHCTELLDRNRSK